MPRQTSAGVLAYRWRDGAAEYLLVHPGGPYWAGKDEAAWSIPKGLVGECEDDLAAARREFAEELGLAITGKASPLTPCPTPGKLILAWLTEADLDLDAIVSNDFEIEWPPHSGRRARFPEVDRAAYFDAATALRKIHKGQRPILSEAISRLKT
jgi:predicted NUDIX family NTP pyrophosphohydrolase